MMSELMVMMSELMVMMSDDDGDVRYTHLFGDVPSSQ
jgi:hypothetical protein